jgi:hypothetical protein
MCGRVPAFPDIRTINEKKPFYFWLVNAFVFETVLGTNPIVQATKLFKFKVAKKPTSLLCRFPARPIGFALACSAQRKHRRHHPNFDFVCN